MSRRARDVTRQAAGQGSARLRDQPAAATRNQAEPRAQRILDLQRTAGNAAVVRPSTIAATKARELTHRAGLLFSRAQAPRRLGGRRDDAIKLYEEQLASGHESRRKEVEFHLHELRAQRAEPR